MFKQYKILSIIPARGGSKGIPNKNIQTLCGKPLIAYSVLAALKSRYIDDVIVSTDSLIIQETARQSGAWVPFLRPAELAADTSKTIDCMLHAIRQLSNIGKSYDYVILLQPTQPLRKPEWIDAALEQLIQAKADSLVSICQVSEHPILMRTITKEGTLKPLLPVSSTVRRQDFPNVYRVNGSIYINRINEHFNETTSLNDNLLPFLMEQEYSIDIDTMEDLKKAEAFLQHHPLF